MGVDSPDRVTSDHTRGVKRARVLLAAKIRTVTGEVNVRLRDLSRKGALIELGETLALGDAVIFSRGKTVVPSRVAWTGGNRAGLEFLEPIDETEVLVHVSRPASTREAPQRFRRSRILSEDLNQEERRRVNAWARSVGMVAPHD